MQGPQKNTNIPWWSKMVIYWLEDQIAILFHADLPPTAGKKAVIDSLHLDGLNKFLIMYGYQLSSFQEYDVLHVKDESEDEQLGQKRRNGDLNSLLGKHLFHHPSGQGSLIKCFFYVEQITAGYTVVGTPAMRGVGMSALYNSSVTETNTICAVVNLINNNRDVLKQEAKITIVAASPNWLSGATFSSPLDDVVPDPVSGPGCITHFAQPAPYIPVQEEGTPLAPAIPVGEEGANWHIKLPDLSSTMQARTGAGVTVFALDTSPSRERIIDAANRAGKNNLLLQTIAKQITGPSPSIVLTNLDKSLPAVLDEDNPKRPTAGRDIHGRLSGYDVTDHGLFVMGIIRDIAPNAKIECVRVLNNSGVGSMSVLIEALEAIHNRLLPINPDTGKEGDLYDQPVVINLSLATMPHQDEIVQLWSAGNFSQKVRMTEDTEPLPHSLHAVIQSLTALGAVIVGAAGNDSDVRQPYPPSQPTTTLITSQRMKPRFPAAFPEVISVGAVDGTGHVALYSNDPVAAGATQHNGIATFGGGIPTPVFPSSSPGDPPPADGAPFDARSMTNVDLTKIDALVGVCTAQLYPALSVDDQPRQYQAPNDYAWAYWSGTSFATPIISAVAARLLEEITTNPKTSNWQPYQWHYEVLRAFTNAQGQRDWLTGGEPLPVQQEFSQDAGTNIGLLKAEQTMVVEREEDAMARVVKVAG